MNRLLQLFADNRAANKTARVQSRLVAEGEEATLYLYESVVADDATADWWGGVSAQSLVPQIRAITAQTIHLRINSPGGDVFAAQAIAQAIRDTKAHVVAHVDGYAAKCGKPKDEVKAWMDAETWFSAQEAVDAGLVDRIAEGSKAKASAWNLSAYTGAPATTADDAALQAHRDRQAQRLSVMGRASPIV